MRLDRCNAMDLLMGYLTDRTAKLLSFVIMLAANLFICKADYTLRTKNPGIVKISLVLTPAFARMRGSGHSNSDFVGFLPELLKTLHDRQGIGAYMIVPATDNVIGNKLSNGSWTGLMYDVTAGPLKGNVIGAGPILNLNTYESVAKLSKSWTSVHLTLVVKNTSNITSLQEALDRQLAILAVSNSPELAEVQTGTGFEKRENLLTRITQTNRFVDNVEEGLRLVSQEHKTALLMNSEEAKYYVTHDFCNLMKVNNFHKLGEYVFVLDPNSYALENLNTQLHSMQTDKTLDRLREKEIGLAGTCSKGSEFHLDKTLTFLVAVAMLISSQILS